MAPSARGAGSRVIGNWNVGKTIGEGTFGKVKTGTHILTGEKVAIKVLDKSRIVDMTDVQRVAREIKILKRNLHQNVIQLYEVLDTPNTIYLIMEHADRGELFDYIVNMKRVPEEQARVFFHQIIDGVDYLHRIGVTHRDLKPENLLLQKSKNGKLMVKIVDFGLSNTHEGGRKLRTACGSPCYAAPEMIRGNGEQPYEGPKADIWSLGVILFALVCGYLPFEDSNTSKLYKKILEGRYSMPENTDLSAGVKGLIKQILNTDPNQRITIDEIRKDPWYNEKEIEVAPESSVPDVESINEDVLAAAEKFGLQRKAVVEAVLNCAHNNYTATYYLLGRKLAREKNASVSNRVAGPASTQGKKLRASVGPRKVAGSSVVVRGKIATVRNPGSYPGNNRPHIPRLRLPANLVQSTPSPYEAGNPNLKSIGARGRSGGVSVGGNGGAGMGAAAAIDFVSARGTGTQGRHVLRALSSGRTAGTGRRGTAGGDEGAAAPSGRLAAPATARAAATAAAPLPMRPQPPSRNASARGRPTGSSHRRIVANFSKADQAPSRPVVQPRPPGSTHAAAPSHVASGPQASKKPAWNVSVMERPPSRSSSRASSRGAARDGSSARPVSAAAVTGGAMNWGFQKGPEAPPHHPRDSEPERGYPNSSGAARGEARAVILRPKLPLAHVPHRGAQYTNEGPATARGDHAVAIKPRAPLTAR